MQPERPDEHDDEPDEDEVEDDDESVGADGFDDPEALDDDDE